MKYICNLYVFGKGRVKVTLNTNYAYELWRTKRARFTAANTSCSFSSFRCGVLMHILLIYFFTEIPLEHVVSLYANLSTAQDAHAVYPCLNKVQTTLPV